MTKKEKIEQLQKSLEQMMKYASKDKIVVYLTKEDLFLKEYLQDINVVVVEKDKLPSNCEIVIGIKPEPINYGNYGQEIEIDINKVTERE